MMIVKQLSRALVYFVAGTPVRRYRHSLYIFRTGHHACRIQCCYHVSISGGYI